MDRADAHHDPRLLQLSPKDNVAAAVESLRPGEKIAIGGQTIVLRQEVPTGHKVALLPIAVGESVIKYGLPIGAATADIQPGDWVHTHNLKSNYLPTYTLDGANPYLRRDEIS